MLRPYDLTLCALNERGLKSFQPFNSFGNLRVRQRFERLEQFKQIYWFANSAWTFWRISLRVT